MAEVTFLQLSALFLLSLNTVIWVCICKDRRELKRLEKSNER